MKCYRPVLVGGLLLLTGAVLGCGQQAAVLPTDPRSKDLAQQPPPPIVGMNGGPGTSATNANKPGVASARNTGGRSKLHGNNQ